MGGKGDCTRKKEEENDVNEMFGVGDSSEGPIFMDEMFLDRKAEDQRHMCLLDFSLQVKKSTIESAGCGLFVMNKGPRRFISPGTVIAIFPGHVHLLEYCSKLEYLEKLFPDSNFHLTRRQDGHLIDSRDINQLPSNPIALAHMVNHVPSGKHPNVIQIPFDFLADPWGTPGRDGFPKELRKYIPLRYAKPPTMLGTVDQRAYMHAMVLVTIRPLRNGDEIFMNYRLNANNPSDLPVWYAPYETFVDDDDDDDDDGERGGSDESKNHGIHADKK